VKVVFSAQARQGLTEIGDYIALDNPTRARNFMRKLRQKALQIAHNPRFSPFMPRHEQTGIRRRPYGNYVIFYRIEDREIAIIHILHAARDYEKVLFPED
jgi:plasmid stabilization system protein ParE